MCDNCKDKKVIKEIKEIEATKEEKAQPIAMQIIKEKVNTIKILAIIIVIQSGMMAAVAWKILDFFYGYEIETIKVESTEGMAVYQNSAEGDNIINGQSDSKENETQR